MLKKILSGIAMADDILDDHDRIVNDQTDGRRQSAKRHQIEAFAQ